MFAIVVNLLLPIPPVMAAVSGLIGAMIGVFYYLYKYSQHPVDEYIDAIEEPMDPVAEVAQSFDWHEYRDISSFASRNLRVMFHLTAFFVAIVLRLLTSLSTFGVVLGGVLGIVLGEGYLFYTSPDHFARPLLERYDLPVRSTAQSNSAEEPTGVGEMIDDGSEGDTPAVTERDR